MSRETVTEWDEDAEEFETVFPDMDENEAFELANETTYNN